MKCGGIVGRLAGSVAVAAGLLTGVELLPSDSERAGAATGTPIVLGVMCSCTGPEASSTAQTTPVIEAWAKYVNAHGGIKGHPVSLIVKDDQFNAGTAIADIEQMVTRNHVVGIFDWSNVDGTFSSYLEQHHVPVLGGQTSAEGFMSSDWFVPGSTFDTFTNALGAAAKKAGIKKLANLYCAEAPACSQSTAAFKAVLPKYDVQLAYTASISFSAPSYAAQCLAAKNSGATGMVVGDASAIVAKVVTDCATQGFEPTELTGDGTVAVGWLKIPQMEGLLGVQEDLPWFVHNSATKPMYDALAKYAPQVLHNNPNFGEIVVEAWANGELARAAMNAAHLTSAQPTAADMLNGLYALPKGTTLGGLTPPLHFKKGQPNPNRCWFTMSVKNAKFVLSNNGKLTCV